MLHFHLLTTLCTEDAGWLLSFFYEYLVQDAKKYQEPQKKFKGILAIDPDNEKDLKDMESVLKEQLEDDKLDAREVINKAIQIIISIGKGDSEL